MGLARLQVMSLKKAAVFTIVLTFGPLGCTSKNPDRQGLMPRHDETSQPGIPSNQQTVPPSTPNAPNPDR